MNVYLCDICERRIDLRDINVVSFFPKVNAPENREFVKSDLRLELCDDCYTAFRDKIIVDNLS